MCQAMAAGSERLEAYPEVHLRRQLAATVRKIQWSYAIFWSNSTRQQGVLSWSDGYYNGDIKTRKTTQAMEFQDDPMGLQRSEQLRELYVSLSAGDSNQQTRRPVASLTPEDLTDTEWYYLVCMSFTFTPGQCLPGRALMDNQHIWLTDARFADTKLFSRSLLAKSASIQTVVCFPFMNGILEFGTTEMVLEDPAIVQQVTTSFLDAPVSFCSEQSLSSPSLGERDEDILCPNFDHDIVESVILSNHDAAAASQAPLENPHLSFPFTPHSFASNEQNNGIEGQDMDLRKSMFKEVNVVSSGDSSLECCAGENNDDSFLIEGLNDMTDDDFRNSLYGSLNSNDFISASFVNPQRILLSSPKGDRTKKPMIDNLQEINDITSLVLDGGDDSHYSKTVATILSNSQHLPLVQCFLRVNQASNFTVWKKDLSFLRPLTCTPQKLLKNILMDAARMHGGQKTNTFEENGHQEKSWKSEGDDAGMSHVISERKRREKLNEKFLVLRTIVPSISKVDKASVLGDTIEYLKELESRVEELETSRDFVELEFRGTKKQHPDVAERTSDNYGSKEIRNSRKTSANKRKVCHINEADGEFHWILSKDGHANVNVTVIEKEVLIDMHCPWRDCLLLEVVESLSNLHLDPFSVQSSTMDGITTLTIKSKFMGSIVASPGMIKRALQRVVAKY